MLNEFRGAWVVHASVRTGQNTDFQPWSLFPQLPVSDNGGLPTMTMTGYTGMFYDYGKGYPFPEYDIEFSDNFTKVAGRHTWKFGAIETGYKNYIKQGGPALSASLGNPLGTLTFTGAWTGNQRLARTTFLAGQCFRRFFAGNGELNQLRGSAHRNCYLLATVGVLCAGYVSGESQADPELRRPLHVSDAMACAR